MRRALVAFQNHRKTSLLPFEIIKNDLCKESHALGLAAVAHAILMHSFTVTAYSREIFYSGA